jgi:carboxylesterase type B
MTLFGQSAGGVAVDAYNLAYPDDPVVTGLIMNSGTASLQTFSGDRAQSNFAFVAKSLGCKKDTAAAEIECLRGVPYLQIENFLKTHQDGGKMPPISFVPVRDEVTFFADPPARAKQGKLTKLVRTGFDETSLLLSPIICTNSDSLPSLDPQQMKGHHWQGHIHRKAHRKRRFR